ncbi:hypothetical protein PVAP13_2NG066000 [Panicum virgatum]|uniref:Meg domain-containing protein n=1 Tax=Panicum virgatum TaxID=38727 RepID=A0A8T0VF27_PANVG|nr:hypothetical protein PVAP13_2NG066000 [Panicum virgatum]
MDKYAKNVLAFLSLLLLGFFTAHVQGQEVGEAGAPVLAHTEDDDSEGARCMETTPPRTCNPSGCWCCSKACNKVKCFAKQDQCIKACFSTV